MPTMMNSWTSISASGTILAARPRSHTRNRALKLRIDSGETGVRQSSAQITKQCQCDQLIGRQVVAVVNFPRRHVAGYRSDALVPGVVLPGSDIVLLTRDANVPDGARIG